jgi:hypothetical protein
MDEEIRKDIEFVRAVNAQVLGQNATLMAAANAEPYRQCLVETEVIGTVTPEEWFTAPNRQHWAKVIRDHRKAYEAQTVEEVAEPAQDTEMLSELKKLRAEVAKLQAAQSPAEPAAEEPAETEAPEADTEPESEGEDEADTEEA